MSRRKQSDVNPENIGRLFFQPGNEVPFRLIKCDTEPKAIMKNVGNIVEEMEYYVSDFAEFRLIPESLVSMPEKPKPPRADKGKTHKKAEKAIDIVALDTEDKG